MYGSLTNRACVAMQLAEQEARHFGHDYIGTEHILLGLVKEGVRTMRRPGVAARVLKQLGLLDLRKVRIEVEKVLHSGGQADAKGGVLRPSQATEVVKRAGEEASRLNLADIGTGFLLLGI